MFLLTTMRHTLLVLLVYTSISHAQQTNPTYTNLILEGGGIRGFAYTGAFEVLDSMGILKDIQRVGGSSAGAVQAMLVAVGYTPKEIVDLANHLSVKQLNDGAWLFWGGTWRLTHQMGWYKGKEASKWIEKLIAAKTGNGNITFQELHDLRKEKGYRDLYIVGADLTFQCTRILSHEQYPTMRIKDAVRISMSIPLYYPPILMDDEGKVHKQANLIKPLHVMVDGGVLNNYPLGLFDSTKYFIHSVSSINLAAENPHTLGLLLEHPVQIAFQYAHHTNAPLEAKNLNEYSKALYATLVDRPNPENLGYYKLKRTIVISHLGLSPRVRKLSPATVQHLVESGKAGTRNFFTLP